MKRIHRKANRSTDEQARHAAIRDEFQAQRPGLDALIQSGKYDGPIEHGATLDALAVASLLKQARQTSRLSLSEVAERCGLDRSAISRLENGVYENTTIHTLNRLAHAYDKRFVVDLVDAHG